ncbi:MAG: Ig-like domain repeat protein [Candidatus Acidiferrum sp.]
MKTNSQLIRNAIMFFSAILLFVAAPASAQTSQARAGSFLSQTPNVPARVTQEVDNTKLVTLKGNVHPLARAEFDQGAVPDSTPAPRMLLLLQRSSDQQAALSQLLDQQQDKSSVNYHSWLTPDQFASHFGPADSDVQAITNWLQSQGFQSIKVGAGRSTIEFTGTTGQIKTAFHTAIHQFFVNGQQHLANISDPQIPAALAPVVSGVVGLHNFHAKSQLHRPRNFQVTSATVNGPKPQITFQCSGGSGTVPCYGVAPADFSTIYGIPSTATGSGVTIAIVQDSDIFVTDIQQFRQLFGLPDNFTASNIILNGPDPGVQGPDSASFDEGEAVLDVEWSGAVAPQAKIDLVLSETSQTVGAQGVDLSAVYIIDNNLAPILSESFGLCEADLGSSGVEFYDALWSQAAAQGITVILSAGDSGSDGCDAETGTAVDFSSTGLGVSGLASTPYNVVMGGTDFQNSLGTFWNTPGTATESAKAYIPESTWNSSCAATAATGSLSTCTAAIINEDTLEEDGVDLVGGSGGESAFNARPSWQVGITPSADTFRDMPDLSLFAAINTTNNDFYITCEEDTPSSEGGQNGNACSLGQTVEISPVGGTSAAAPDFAGIMALVIQQQGGARQGNANYVLYQLYKNNLGKSSTICASNVANITATGCVFYDTIAGNNSTACEGGTTNCSNTSTAANQYGVLVDPAAKTNPAFLAVAGYDKATGLGSVNVGNLLTNWSLATFNSTTTTITTTPTGTIAHGATVTFKVGVTSGSGTPTGNVSLLASPPGSAPTEIGLFSNTTTSTFALSGGTATITTNLLPGYVVNGTATPYPVVAQYAGDGTFAGSTSAPMNVTVGQEGSATAVSLLVGTTTATTVPYGSPYILRVDVVGTGSNSNSQECSTTAIPCPTGSITLKDNGNNLNDFPITQSLNSTNTATLLNDLGFLEDQDVQLGGGTNNIVATYSGDSSYTTSTSAMLAITVTTAATASVVTASSNSTNTNTAVTLTATIETQSSGLGPTGTVTFAANGTTIGTASSVGTAAAGLNTTSPVAAFGTATLPHTFSTAGTYTIAASYAGDANYATSSSSGTSNASVSVTQAQVGNIKVTESAVTLSSATGASVSSTVTATPSGGFTGMVAVTPSASTPGVTCSPSPLDLNVTGASAVSGQLMCSVLVTSTTLTASNALSDRMLEAKTTPPSKGDKGWWALSAGTGFASLFLLFLPGGRKRYRAALGLGLVCLLCFTLGCGGGGGGTPPPPPPLTATHTVLTVTNAKVASGTAFSFSVAVTGGTPTGQVALFDGGSMIGTAANVSGGTATPTAPALAVGTHAISAHYLGDATTAASASGPINMTVTGTTTVAIATNPAASPAAPPLSVTIN